MEPATIGFLIYLVVASPVIWWLMWREDFDGMQSEWRFNRERRTRQYLSPQQFYDQFYKSSGIKKGVVFRLLALHAEIWEVEPGLIRPHDNYPRIYDGGDDGEFVDRVQSDFGVTISDEDLATIEGTFDSIARYVDAHSQAS
jgi:hypothetical protein